jgi:serine/threonine protein kinase
VEDRTFGARYRVTEKIGSGGMAEVYKAVDEVLGRTVAVKVLHPRYASDPTFVARFRQEAQAAANLSNPHIVNIYDWGQDDSTYYIVMEFVRGTDLKSLVEEKGAIDPLKAADYAAQVCTALAVAHGYDIVHRDIKPHNVVLAPDGQIKVMDFGIARAGNTTMTQTGSVLGTAQYISPEQAQGRPLGPASDLYSLGIVLYELTTGRLPFDADTPVAVALKQVNEMPAPPRALNANIPPALEAIILRAMQKDPAARYASAEEMRADLRRFAAGQPVESAPASRTTVMPAVTTPAATSRRATPPRKKRTVWPWVLGALLLLAAIAGLAYAIARSGPSTVSVPSVKNQRVDEASATIAASGLAVGDVTTQNDDNVKLGLVISQDPAAGQPVPKGTAIALVVSGGILQVKVPDVGGKTENDAFNLILDAQLRIAKTTTFGKETPGTVIAQDPKPDAMVPKNTVVTITVSSGTEKVTVPDVRTKSRADARAELKKAGFSVVVKDTYSNDIAAGIVTEQSPGPGVLADKNSEVTINVSKGPETFGMPLVKGMTEAQAKEKLVGLELVVSVTTETATANTVLDQNPAEGTQVKKGDNVSIKVGVVPPPATSTP